MEAFTKWVLPVSFKTKLVQARKEKGFTQRSLADASGLHVNQIKRYEVGLATPSMEALKKIAVTLNTSLDNLVFDRDEREPDQELKFQFEAIQSLAPKDKMIVQEVLGGLLLRYQAKRWITSDSPSP